MIGSKKKDRAKYKLDTYSNTPCHYSISIYTAMVFLNQASCYYVFKGLISK